MDAETLTNGSKNEAVFSQLKQFVSEIVGADVIDEIGMSRESIFTKDLEMDSIEVVAFAEKIKKKYGKELDFISWISSMEFQDLYNLSVGQVVDFIANGNNSGK